MRKPRFALAMLLLLSLQSAALAAQAGRGGRSGERDEIIEAVFRYQIEHHSPARGYRVYYLAVGGGRLLPPADRFMRRFGGHLLPVKKFVRSAYEPVRLEAEGGIVLGVGSIERVGKRKVKVYGYSFTRFSEGLNWIFDLRREGRVWVVTDVANFNLS